MTLTQAQRRRIDRIARGRSDEPLHLLEGPRAVRDALAAGAVAEVWVRDDLPVAVRDDLESAAGRHGVPIGAGSRGDFERLGRTVTPQGVLALVRDTALSLAALLARPGLLLWLDGLQDPGNVGAALRVGVAFDVAGALVSSGGADPLGLKALRASAGLALRLPFARAAPAAAAEHLRASGRPVWMLARDGDDAFAVTSVPRDLVLVVGSEGSGPSEAAAAVASRRLGIPIAPTVDSLNAAVAVGIAVAALRRAARPGQTT